MILRTTNAGSRTAGGIKRITALAAALSPAALQAAQPSALPMRPGYYAESPQSCAVAQRDLSGMVVRARGFEYMDVAISVVRVVRGAKGSYTLTERAEGEGGANTYRSSIRIIDTNSFVRTHPDFSDPKAAPVRVTYRFCSSKIPRDWN